MGPPTVVTVMDVFRKLRLEPTKEASWSAGARVREAYFRATGLTPRKENHPKTSGGGSHCFAEYPLSFAPKIEEIVRACAKDVDRQKDLFDD